MKVACRTVCAPPGDGVAHSNPFSAYLYRSLVHRRPEKPRVAVMGARDANRVGVFIDFQAEGTCPARDPEGAPDLRGIFGVDLDRIMRCSRPLKHPARSFAVGGRSRIGKDAFAIPRKLE